MPHAKDSRRTLFYFYFLALFFGLLLYLSVLFGTILAVEVPDQNQSITCSCYSGRTCPTCARWFYWRNLVAGWRRRKLGIGQAGDWLSGADNAPKQKSLF
jgi:hypothetical protein